MIIIQSSVFLVLIILQNAVKVKCFFSEKYGFMEILGGSMDATYVRIKSLCDEHGIKMSALASEIGVRSSVFTELKMGRTKQLSAKTLQAIANYFDISVDSLMPVDASEAVDMMRDEIFRKRRMLFDLSAKASPEELDTILRVVNALIAQP